MRLYILKTSKQVLTILQVLKLRYSINSMNLMWYFRLQIQLYRINKNLIQVIPLKSKKQMVLKIHLTT